MCNDGDFELKDIPKLYLIDACRKDKKIPKPTRGGASNLNGTLFATTEGNIVRGGKCAYAITNVMENNYETNSFKPFEDIRKESTKLVKELTDQSIMMEEYDNDMDLIIYKPNNK